ncbi:MAG TPA: hypothetical protein VNM47_18940 [Terriglobia bacterium]|nr:hypothetical protein [Terriglobia bacterium]
MSKVIPAFLVAFLAVPALAKKPAPAPTCETKFTVVIEDDLHNIKQGLADKDVKWFKKEIEKKYPDVCYVAPAPEVPLVFYISTSPAVYHGTRRVTTQSQSKTDISGDVDATARTATDSESTVPYDVNYDICTLTIETRDGPKNWKARHRFQQKGLFHTYAGIPLGGKGHHPIHTVIQEAAKWVHEGGLTNPLETVAPQ